MPLKFSPNLSDRKNDVKFIVRDSDSEPLSVDELVLEDSKENAKKDEDEEPHQQVAEDKDE